MTRWDLIILYTSSCPNVSSFIPLNRLFPTSMKTEDEHTLCHLRSWPLRSALSDRLNSPLEIHRRSLIVLQMPKSRFSIGVQFSNALPSSILRSEVPLTLLSHHPPTRRRHPRKPDHIPSCMDRYLFLRPLSHHRRQA